MNMGGCFLIGILASSGHMTMVVAVFICNRTWCVRKITTVCIKYTASQSVCSIAYKYRNSDQFYFIVYSLGSLRNRCQVDVIGIYLGRAGEGGESVSLWCRSGRREGRKENRKILRLQHSSEDCQLGSWGVLMPSHQLEESLTSPELAALGPTVLSHWLWMTSCEYSLSTNPVLSPEGQELGQQAVMLPAAKFSGLHSQPVPHRSTSPCRFRKERLHGFHGTLSGHTQKWWSVGWTTASTDAVGSRSMTGLILALLHYPFLIAITPHCHLSRRLWLTWWCHLNLHSWGVWALGNHTLPRLGLLHVSDHSHP